MTDILRKIRKKHKIFEKMTTDKKLLILLMKYDISEIDIQKVIVKDMFYSEIKQSKITVIKNIAKLIKILKRRLDDKGKKERTSN